MPVNSVGGEMSAKTCNYDKLGEIECSEVNA